MAAVRPTGLTAALVLALTLLVPVAVGAQNGRAPLLNAEAVVLLDGEGHTLYAKNPDEPRAPASLVKLMTLYLAFDAIENGGVDPDQSVVVTSYAASTPRYRMGVRAGEAVPLRVLLEGVAIASANDAATAVAETLAGCLED
jgi:D-alanyl-D-alanine carboxypeptidase